jgi:hypothetical protein
MDARLARHLGVVRREIALALSCWQRVQDLRPPALSIDQICRLLIPTQNPGVVLDLHVRCMRCMGARGREDDNSSNKDNEQASCTPL